jgi:hypothetical protein
MKKLPIAPVALAFAMAAAGLASAQGTPLSNPGSAPPNAPLKSPDQMGPGPLAQGQNSFTRDEARSRIERAGYTRVAGLIQDAQGLWHARAMRDGRPVNVALDYKGDVAPQ